MLSLIYNDSIFFYFFFFATELFALSFDCPVLAAALPPLLLLPAAFFFPLHFPAAASPSSYISIFITTGEPLASKSLYISVSPIGSSPLANSDGFPPFDLVSQSIRTCRISALLVTTLPAASSSS